MSASTHPPQNLANHSNTPRLFMAIFAVLLIEELRLIWLLFTDPGWGSTWNVLVGAALMTFLPLVRLGHLRLQDRLITTEMELRLERVLGADRRSQITDLRRSQLIALRFASDEELPALVSDITAGKLTSQDEIKQRVTHWQADWFRV
ncbi:MAG: hypothetical protein ACI9EF_000398 [Pseudohongiellaceae bacterium]|jgi:hypothetical protein